MSLFSRKAVIANTAKILIGTFLLLEGAPALAATKEAAPPTNFQIMRTACMEAAGEIANGLAVQVGGERVLLVKAKGAGDADFLFDNALIETLNKGGVKTAIDAKGTEESAASDSAAYALSYQIVRLGLKYPRIARRWWFGSKLVDRAVNVDVTAQLVNRRNGDVLWIRDGSSTFNDTVLYSQLGAVEEKYEFTRPARNEFKSSKLLEPVIVAGIVVGLVYLFFSNQSNG